jgi:tetratricopeptide (TPR) repeat protein
MAWRGALVIVCLMMVAPSAQAQRLLLQSIVNRCNNVRGEFTADQSIDACTQIIRSDGVIGHALAATYNTRAMRYLQKHDDARALADFSEAIRYSPRYAKAFLNRAALHMVQHDYAPAIADYDAAVAILPNIPLVYVARCWARALSGQDLELGRADCDFALHANPHNPQALDSRGMVDLREGRFSDALNDYDAAAQLDASSARHRYGRGIAALRLGRAEEGQADLSAAVQLDPNIAQTYAQYGMAP